ncbi:uncharacterized protein A4U43_C06F12780 [Asparagus officinalis]|uniref:Uncharacterized protein n=1 Tax=Asparagus officinalis TaxID=4686 RepID=A0A5P1ES34_ASPOF|nr:uncharacterized protein A4U43_C06F12780 [Asparagus officinalis]
MNAPRHMFKYVARIDAVDHFPWATIIYKELWDSFKAVKKATKGLTYLSGCAPLLSDDAYKKLVMLNESYEQELAARGVDTMAIKAEIEKRFEEEKQIMPKKEEAEKEGGKEEKAEGEGDQGQEVGVELEQSEARKVVEEVPKKKRGRKRREEGEATLGEFVQGLRARSRRTTKKPKSLESPYCTEMPKKKMKGKKVSLW